MSDDDYDRDGYALAPDLVSGPKCEEIITAARTLPECTSSSPAMQPHRRSTVISDALRSPRVVNLVKDAIKATSVSCIQSEFFYCSPGTKGYALHQDNYFVRCRSPDFASVWIPLVDDVTPKKGGLVVYPGSHRSGLWPVRLTGEEPSPMQDASARTTEAVVFSEFKPVDLTIEKRGTAVLLHGDTVHGSHDNESDLNRYVLLLTYVKRGATFRPGRYSKREEIPVD